MGKKDRISVMQVVDSLQGGGMERVAVSLANGLAHLGHESHLLATRSEGLLLKSVAKNVRAWCACRKWRWDFGGIRRIAEYIDTNSIDIVHSHNHTSSYLMRVVFRFCKSKPVHIIHDHHGPALYSRKLAVLDWLMLRHVDSYIAVTEALRDRAKKLLSLRDEQCIYMPNGVEISPLHPRWNGRPAVVQVANLQWPKGHETAMWAAAMVRRSVPDLNWICVGRVPDPPTDYVLKIHELIKSLNLSNNVTLIGECSDVRAVLRRSHVGVSTSDYEGLAMSVLECMAEQLPVVITDVGQAPDIVREAKAGIVVPAGTPDRFAEEVVRLLSNAEEARLMGENGRNCAASQFSVEVMVQNLASIYEQCMDNQR